MPKKKPGAFQPSKKARFLFVFWIAAFHVFSAKAAAQSFTKIVDPSNPAVNDVFNSGGGSWIDVNNDDFLDLFVAHGNDISQNNSLYLNNKNGSFISVKTGAIVSDGGKSIGSVWGDYDNDGNPDAFVTNRFNFGNFLYHGNGDTTFTKITTGQIVTDLASSNSSHWIDVDNDGALDLFVANRLHQKNLLYRNNGNGNHWIEIKCAGMVSNRTAIGTKMRLKATINGVPRWQMQVLLSIYNMLGERLVTLVDRVQEAGSHSITWNGRDEKGHALPSGIYLCRIKSESFNQTMKLALVK